MTGTGAPRAVLFTDLDGTLLDESYRPGVAAAAVARLQEAGVLVVFCSSKTRAEQEPLRRILDVTGPFIVENGSAVLLPRSRTGHGGAGVRLLGVRVGTVRSELAAARRRLGLVARGFGEMSAPEVAAATGLSLEGARRARRREFSETVVGLGVGEAERLGGELRDRGLVVRSGGRFHTVTGAGADKGRALAWLMERLRHAPGCAELASVAVGDSDNDVPMLQAADRAFLVAGGGGVGALPAAVERLRGTGPAGFAELAERLVEELAPRQGGPGREGQGLTR